MSEDEWLTCNRLGAMLKCLSDKASERKMRLFALSCCRRIADLLRDEWGLPTIDVAEQFVEGQTTVKRLKAANTALQGAFNRQVLPRGSADLFAAHAVWCATCLRAAPGRYDAAIASRAGDGAAAARGKLLRANLRSRSTKERNAQCQLLRCIFGNPFRPPPIEPAWLTPTAVSLAHAASEERLLPSGELDQARLAILADALEEAGCTNADVLSHLRGPGPHVRGCWPVDLCLARG